MDSTNGYFIVIYKYKGKHYQVLSFGEMKNPHTRLWEDCVIYIQLENRKTYVRNREEFFEKFKESNEQD